MIGVLKNTLIQFGLLFGVVGLAGLALTLLSRWTNNLFRQFAWPQAGTYLFGWIGVPVHEFCHAFFCAIFLHEIKTVKWFDPKGKSGAHGAVTHTYHPWNLYHRVGHFFIGLGPILLAPVLLALVAFLLVPEARTALLHPAQSASWWSTLAPLVSKSNLTSFGFWVFVYLAMCVSSQIELSTEDLKQAATGVLPVVFVLGFANLAAWSFDLHWHGRVVAFATRLATLTSGLYAFAALISALNLAICWIVIGVLNKLTGREVANPFRS